MLVRSLTWSNGKDSRCLPNLFGFMDFLKSSTSMRHEHRPLGPSSTVALPGSARAKPLRKPWIVTAPGDVQQRPGQIVHQLCLARCVQGPWHPDLDGRKAQLDGQCFHRAPQAPDEYEYEYVYLNASRDFKNAQHEPAVWMNYYNNDRTDSALGNLTPGEAYAGIRPVPSVA